MLYLEAEQRAGHGIADLSSLETAAQLEPAQPAASALLHELRGLRLDSEHRWRLRLGLAAAAMLVVAALRLLITRPRAKRERSPAAVRGSSLRQTGSRRALHAGDETTKSPST